MLVMPVLVLALGAAVLATPQQESAQAHFERGRGLFEEHDDTGEGEFRRARKR